MSYIIVWRSTHSEPFVDVDSSHFIENYFSYGEAKENAEEIKATENAHNDSQWYFDYKIYKEVNS